MSTSPVILDGTVVIEGVPFRWWVTDGLVQRLTVSHPAYGTDGQRLTMSPQSQARLVARAMLNSKVVAAGFLEAVDDAPLADEPDPPTID